MSVPCTPPPSLDEFLNEEPPIYIGFGSIIVDDPKRLTLLLLEAVHQAGVRAIISQGWGELGSEDLVIPPTVHLLGNCPHDWIFAKVSCVVHHGGAGTTAAAMAAGKPSIVVPFFGDQPFWGEMVAKIGAGPKPIPFKKLTATNLAAAIRAALEPAIVQRAKELGDQVHQESGVDAGVTSFHQSLQHSNLGCSIASTHAAAWKVRKTNIRLGCGAAAVLVDRDLLDIDKIELYVSRKLNMSCPNKLILLFLDSEHINMN
jgi:UDP:flavonoid glycosyltransferase YjiC (YdhE family)